MSGEIELTAGRRGGEVTPATRLAVMEVQGLVGG